MWIIGTNTSTLTALHRKKPNKAKQPLTVVRGCSFWWNTPASSRPHTRARTKPRGGFPFLRKRAGVARVRAGKWVWLGSGVVCGVWGKPPLCKGRWHGEAVTEGLFAKKAKQSPTRFAGAPFTQGGRNIAENVGKIFKGSAPSTPLTKTTHRFSAPRARENNKKRQPTKKRRAKSPAAFAFYIFTKPAVWSLPQGGSFGRNSP